MNISLPLGPDAAPVARTPAGEASAHPLAALHRPGTIRLRCAAIARAVERDLSPHFRLDRSALPALAERVIDLMHKRFPDGNVPLHSRWRHFQAGGVDRKAEFDQRLAGRSLADLTRARFDLSVVSVLLDAGAGSQWTYQEPQPGADPEVAVYRRSEGLAVATFRAFVEGRFSATADDPLRVDARALKALDIATLRSLFQSHPNHPLLGLEGRVGLLHRLGDALTEEVGRRARAGLPSQPARAALLFDALWADAAPGPGAAVRARDILAQVLRVLGPVWQGAQVQGLPGGDTWPHRWAGDQVDQGCDDGTLRAASDRTTGGWVPFHKLSLWLSYSLVEPLQWAGITVTDLDALTGLPEYRNGGLFLDGGVIVPRRAHALQKRYTPGDEFIVEWRALTVVLLDELAALIRQRLGRGATELPLAAILEGGTWLAGRELAAECRPDGSPPVQLESDGTLF